MEKQAIKISKSKSTICPRCKGNGYFTVKESVDNPLDKVVQCPMCDSQGEVDETKDSSIIIDADGLHRMH